MAAPGHAKSILAWVAFVPFLLILRSHSPGLSFCLAFLCGLAANAGILHWFAVLQDANIGDFLVIAGYLALWWGLFGICLAVANKRFALPLVITAPALWVTFEYFRSHCFSFLELPWILVGHTQYQWTEIIQIASFTGVYGISYLVMLVNAALADTAKMCPHWKPSLVTAAVLITSSWLFGHMQLSFPIEGRTLPVAVVPGNVPQASRWDPGQLEANFNHYVTETRLALQNEKPALVVWPETAVPGQLRRKFTMTQTLSNLVREGDSSLLIGSADRQKFGSESSPHADHWNSAFLLSPNAPNFSSYNKMKLLPFGEYLPLPDAWFWPERYRMQSGHYVAGQDYTIFHLTDHWSIVPFAVSICWESIFPDHIRIFVQQGAQFLVSISNEAWVSGSTATDQVLAMSVFRAVENHRTLVRSVNGGISAFIDPNGRLLEVMSSEPINQAGKAHMTRAIAVTDSLTFYTKYGDVFAKSLMVFSLAFMIVRFWKDYWSPTMPKVVAPLAAE